MSEPDSPIKSFQQASGVIKLVEDSICPKCGNAFNCSTSSKCWCYEYDVPANIMEKLLEEYEGCLCPDCLKEYSS